MTEQGEVDGEGSSVGWPTLPRIVATPVKLAFFPFSVVAIASYRPRLPP